MLISPFNLNHWKMTESRVTLRGWVGVLGHALQQAVCVKPSWTAAPEQLAGAAAVLWQMYCVGSKLWLLVHPNAWLLGEHSGVHCFSHSRRWLRNLAQVLTRAVGARIWQWAPYIWLWGIRYSFLWLIVILIAVESCWALTATAKPTYCTFSAVSA